MKLQKVASNGTYGALSIIELRLKGENVGAVKKAQEAVAISVLNMTIGSNMSKIRRIIFIVTMPFTGRDYKRFGIDTLEQNGFDVEVWEVSAVLYPKLSGYSQPDAIKYKGLRVFLEKDSLRCAFSGLDRLVLIINAVSYGLKSLWLFRQISRCNVPSAVMMMNALPLVKTIKFGTIRKIGSLLKHSALKTLIEQVFLRLPFKWFGVRGADFIFAGGRKSLTVRQPVSWGSEVIWAHTLDYDIYLELSEQPRATEGDFAVFIDEYIPFHPTLVMWNYSQHEVYAKDYYRSLKMFFDAFERKTRLKVIIAAHPASNYGEDSGYFGGRRVIKGKTAELVRQSDFVLLHCSTAINFAVCFDKPVIFIINDALRKIFPYGALLTEQMAKLFNKEPVYIDKEFELNMRLEGAIDTDVTGVTRSIT